MIKLRNITKVYNLGEVDLPVLKGVSLDIRAGEFVSLTGSSGSGKSTLMNILGCLDRPSDGEYLIDGEDVSGFNKDKRAELRNRRIGFVFQNFNLLSRTSALENVIMPSVYARPALPARVIRQRAIDLLNLVGLSDRMDHTPAQLSGGQQQRVAIARSLINNPSILLADEPTGNLDSITSREILEMFRELNRKEGLSVILVTHDPKIASFTDRAIQMQDGVIIDGAYRSVALDSPRAEQNPPAQAWKSAPSSIPAPGPSYATRCGPPSPSWESSSASPPSSP